MFLKKDRRWFPNPARVVAEAIQIIRAACKQAALINSVSTEELLIQLHQRRWSIIPFIIIVHHHLSISMDEYRIGN